MSALAGLVDRGLVAPDWAEALAPVDDTIAEMGRFLRAELAAGRGYLPAGEHVLRAFAAPLADVRVLIVGQDPYPTPGHPVGLSFSVAPDVRPLPKSLVNIFRELCNDLGCPPPESGDLSPWASRGVLLLNRVLTVQPGVSGSHRGRGWERVTDCAIDALVRRGGPLVAILWGRDAQSLLPALGQGGAVPGQEATAPWQGASVPAREASVPAICSAHPSPLSAHRGFFGSRPFSRANDLLLRQGAAPISWPLR